MEAHDYDKGVNYYTVTLAVWDFAGPCVLGVDEYAPLEEIKKARSMFMQKHGHNLDSLHEKAYKKLSLIYHPDKMAGLSKEDCPEGM
ncbi:sti1 [Symbiodinium natans]|uniref:Sti1 protein n=1 Tax=Symbiodinium natans TaxID=878477 RepID=A0A812S521_9DINO|nr:sti1 [Symbiodinium natans]